MFPYLVGKALYVVVVVVRMSWSYNSNPTMNLLF